MYLLKAEKKSEYILTDHTVIDTWVHIPRLLTNVKTPFLFQLSNLFFGKCCLKF